HTLQLAIGKGLAPAEVFVTRAKRLIQFFQYQKQIERLEEVQKKLDAIIQLQMNLYTSQDREIKKDGTKLKRILLSDNEWELLDQLIDLLMPFEEATREFSGNTYVTLSKVIPTIKEMIFDLACETPLNNDLFLDEATVFGSDNEDMQPIDLNDDNIISNVTRKKISIKNPLVTTSILEQIKKNIYNALINYWNDPNDLGLMAALLDPRNKSLDFLDNDSEKQLTIKRLYDEFNELEEPTSEILIHPTPPNTESLVRSHKEYL
ncbi:3383_t:CDS:2, partial [Ambispora leptoticha]